MQDYPMPPVGKPYIPPSPARLRSMQGGTPLNDKLAAIHLLGAQRASRGPGTLYVYRLTRAAVGGLTNSAANRSRLAWLRGVAGHRDPVLRIGESLEQALSEVQTDLVARGWTITVVDGASQKDQTT